MTDSPSHAGTACDALFADCYFLQHQYVIIKNPFNNPLLATSSLQQGFACALTEQPAAGNHPDLNFWGAADLIAEGDYVVGRWEGGGTHTGPAFSDFLSGSLPAATGRKMRFTGTTVLKIVDGKIVEEVGLDDGVTALTQLGLVDFPSA
jgi:predicted ester cyclase